MITAKISSQSINAQDFHLSSSIYLSGGSEIVVTNNIKDLKAAELTFEELKVLTPGQLLKER